MRQETHPSGHVWRRSCDMTNVMGESVSFSALDVLGGMTRRWFLVANCAVIGVMGGVGVLAYSKSAYQAEAQVLIQDQSTPYDQPNLGQSGRQNSTIDGRVVRSQVAVMESADLALRVIALLELGAMPEFNPRASDMGYLAEFLVTTGFRDDPKTMTLEQRALQHLQDKLTVRTVSDSNVIAIRYSAESGEVAASVANALADTYVSMTREAEAISNKRARDWLSAQITELRARVSISDAAVEKFRVEKGLFRSTEPALASQQVSEINSQIIVADAARREAQARAGEINRLLASGESADASEDVLKSPTIQHLKELQLSATRRVSELSATYMADHPRVVAAQNVLANVERQIRREEMKIAEGLAGQAGVAAARVASLQAGLDALKSGEAAAYRDEARLRDLERDSSANRNLLQTMLARLADSSMRQRPDFQPGMARIIQLAAAPANPSFPRLGPTLLLTTAVGLGTGLLLAFLAELVHRVMQVGSRLPRQSRTMSSRRHPLHAAGGQRQLPDLPLGQVPRRVAPRPATGDEARFRTKRPSGLPPKHAGERGQFTAMVAEMALAGKDNSADQLIAVGALLLDILKQGRTKRIAVAGIGAGNEQAYAAVALSRTLAENGLRTILIDLEPRRSVISDLMALEPAPGLSDLLADSVALADVIQRDPKSPLQVIRRGEELRDGSPDLAWGAEALIATLAETHDAVIVHAGEAARNALTLMKGCGAAVIVAAAQRAADLPAAARTLKSNGMTNVLTIQVRNPAMLVA